MHRLLYCLSTIWLATAALTQEIPGVRASLSAVRTLVAAGSPIELRLVLQVDADAQLPSSLLNGVDLVVHVGDKPGPRIVEAGAGEAVTVRAGTRIERRFSFPSEQLVPNLDPSAISDVVVAWKDIPGANCALKIAPDASKVDLGSLDLGKTRVVLVTNLGEMTLSFRPDKAPRHVENFLKLCKSGFYDGTKFHRVIRDFMIQGGDPNTKDDSKPDSWGQGGPGYAVDAEFNDVRHVRGTLSMARSNDPNSAGSQFFVVHKDAPHLDGKYTAFGNIEKGADTLDRIANVAVGGPQRSTPVEPVVLLSTVILPAKR
jgi:peptidyl-prolyl cis-trans isomerase B (cyclophilin B)